MKKFKMYIMLGLVITAFAGCQDKTNEMPEIPVVIEDQPDITIPEVEVTPEPTAEPEVVDNIEETEEIETTTPSGNPGDHHGEIASLVAQREELYEMSACATKVEEIHNIDKQINELNSCDFSDMKITCLGDSITYGQGGRINEYGNPVSYVDYLKDILGCEVVNMGIPGSSIGDYGSDASMLSRVKEIPEDTDIIIIFGGVNDYLVGNSIFGIEGEYEPKTYLGDTKKMFDLLRQRFPDQEIFVVLTYENQLEYQDRNADTYPFDRWLDVLRCYAKDYNFHKVEMYRNGILDSNAPDVKATYFTDEVHPNDNGYIFIARYLAAKIIEVYN